MLYIYVICIFEHINVPPCWHCHKRAVVSVPRQNTAGCWTPAAFVVKGFHLQTEFHSEVTQKKNRLALSSLSYWLVDFKKIYL